MRTVFVPGSDALKFCIALLVSVIPSTSHTSAATHSGESEQPDDANECGNGNQYGTEQDRKVNARRYVRWVIVISNGPAAEFNDPVRQPTEHGVEDAKCRPEAEENYCLGVTNTREDAPAEQRQEYERKYPCSDSVGSHWRIGMDAKLFGDAVLGGCTFISKPPIRPSLTIMD